MAVDDLEPLPKSFGNPRDRPASKSTKDMWANARCKFCGVKAHRYIGKTGYCNDHVHLSGKPLTRL
jgi:hypothetical protein